MLSVEPTNNQSFKSRTILRVAQKAFNNPADTKACSAQVEKVITGKGRIRQFIDVLKVVILGKKPKKPFVICENGDIVKFDEKDGMNSFYVLTGVDAHKFMDAISLKKITKRMRDEAKDAACSDGKFEMKRTDANEYVEDAKRKLKWDFATSNSKENEIEVNSLQKLAEMKDSILDS